jgi:hypothetical protein
MPKYGIHHIVLEKAIGLLKNDADQQVRQAGNNLEQNKGVSNLGSIGPDLFFWAPDYELADKLFTLYDNIRRIIDIYNTVVEPVRRVKQAVGDAVEETVGTLAPQSVEMIRMAVAELKETAALFKSAVSSSMLSGVIGINDFLHQAGLIPDLTNQLFKTFAPTLQHQMEHHQPFDETEWYWFDVLHYRRTGRFCWELMNRAGSNLQKAYAFGYFSHVATDVTGHAFVNQIVGAPYRLNVQKHVLVENYMDTWAYDHYYNQDVSARLFDNLDLPAPAQLSESIIDLLNDSLRSNYRDLHPNRLRTPGFLTKNEIHSTYERFYTILEVMKKFHIEKPEEPFSNAIDILAEALDDLMEPPPEPPDSSHLGTCGWKDILSVGLSSSSRDCYENFFEEAARYIEYLGELIVWTFETLMDIVDLILAALLSIPVMVLLALLYGIQLLCFEIIQYSRQILAESGFICPDRELLQTSIGVATTTTMFNCSPAFKFPRLRSNTTSHLVCPHAELEAPATAADFHTASVDVNPSVFIDNIPGLPFSIESFNMYAFADAPANTRSIERDYRTIGNATAFTNWLIGNAITGMDPSMLFADWNLDSDRGYGYKNWKGTLKETEIGLATEEYV